MELSPEESRLEVIRQRKKRENGAGDVLKRIVRKRKGNSNRNEDSSGMKSSSVLKRILGHVDLTKFRWYEYVVIFCCSSLMMTNIYMYSEGDRKRTVSHLLTHPHTSTLKNTYTISNRYGWAGPTETIRAVAILHDTRPNVWVRASPEEKSRVWAIRRDCVREVLRQGMRKHRKWIISKLRDASPDLLGILDHSETDAFTDSVRVDTYQDRERVLACGTNSKQFLVVLNGMLEIRQNGLAICELKPGHCFGESSLLIHGKHSDVDIISVSPDTKCLVLTRKSVECVVGPLLSMLKSRDMDVYRRIVVSLV